MSMERVLAGMRSQAQLARNDQAVVRLGTISGYDPDNHVVKVTLEPEGTPTGWMPLATAWVGNGWGLFCAPNIGDRVEVNFTGGDPDAPYAAMRFFGPTAVPLPVPAGEFWLVHASGSKLKFTTDGNVYLSAKPGQQVNIDAPQGQLNITSQNGAIAIQAQGGTAAVNAQTTTVSGTTVNVNSTGALNLTGSTINLN